MFSHVMLGARDIQESKKFYDAVFATMGYKPGVIDPKGRCFYFTEKGTFALSIPINGEDPSHGNGSTIGFAARTPEIVEAFHQAGLDNGGITCEEPPGIREGGGMKLYIAYLQDPAGNKICALHKM